jgi:GAF domain-containing protein
MVDEYDLVEMAHRMCRHSVELLDVAAAGLLLADGRGRLGLLASSNEQAQLIELFQLQAEGEGPCLECFRTGRPVTAANLCALGDRWGGFAAESLRQGFQTVHALPMLLRDQTIGTLNLFRTGAGPLSGEDLALGQALAAMATISILQERALTRTETVVEQFQGALNSRVIIEQAKGVLSNLVQIDIDEAFRVLRRYARAHNRLLAELARTVTTDHTQAIEILDSARSG